MCKPNLLIFPLPSVTLNHVAYQWKLLGKILVKINHLCYRPLAKEHKLFILIVRYLNKDAFPQVLHKNACFLLLHTLHADDRTLHADDRTLHADDRTLHADDRTLHADDRTLHADDRVIAENNITFIKYTDDSAVVNF